jgi:hypothetical protein
MPAARRVYGGRVVTKRPHFVPQTYLRAWADSDGRVAYRRRDGATAILNSTKNVAVVGGLYGDGQLSEAREQTFCELESEWVALRDELITQGDLHGERRSLLAVFMGVQLMRTLKHCNENNFIAEVAATTADRPIPEEAVRGYLRQLDDAEPDPDEVDAALTYVNFGPPGGIIPTRDMVLSVSMHAAVSDIAPQLEDMNWTVRRFRNPILMTNDVPVHKWSQPTGNMIADARRQGLATADEVRFPLAPGALLVMTSPGKTVSNASARRVNAEIVRQCHQFVVAQPADKPALDKLSVAKRGPRLRFRNTDGYHRITGEYLPELLHMYVG